MDPTPDVEYLEELDCEMEQRTHSTDLFAHLDAIPQAIPYDQEAFAQMRVVYVHPSRAAEAYVHFAALRETVEIILSDDVNPSRLFLG
jgi:hypothetical protein